MESSHSSKAPPPQQQQDTEPSVQLPASYGRVCFDRRMLLVYGLLLLDVVVIGITSLQHVWQPANLIDKVLQNHSAPPLQTEGQHHRHLSPQQQLQQQLPVAVKRELGMSCCCGWLALAVMGVLSLFVSYSPSSVLKNRSAPSSSVGVEGRKKQQHHSTAGRRSRAAPAHAAEGYACNVCVRTADEVELQIKLKYLLVAIASFCVFFALNLTVQIHGRFQQSKVAAAAIKTYTAGSSSSGNTEALRMHRPVDLYEAGRSQYNSSFFPLQQQGSQREAEASSSAAAVKQPAQPFAAPQQQQSAAGTLPLYSQGEEGPVQQQSPLYFYWRDFFFWTELSKECFLDGEIQLSSLWVILHAAALLGGRGFLRSRAAAFAAAIG
ncbi:hypothetical protein, conserved [Eimeria brunetti]|uniref:Uncharacterized protein n=1 Tax=Eimeria brunetti TaxID=51314 RepID=U6L903_9EIME|nr:hypothetical protein, conserved [Eimeria brunetti]